MISYYEMEYVMYKHRYFVVTKMRSLILVEPRHDKKNEIKVHVDVPMLAAYILDNSSSVKPFP